MCNLFKRHLFKWSLVTVLLLFLLGCGGLSGPGELGGAPSQKAVQRLSGINDFFGEAVRLKIILNKDIVNREKDFSVTVSDRKIISDIAYMIRESTSFSDKAVTEEMKGALSKKNSLIFTLKDGRVKEVPFRFDGLYELGYLEIDNKKLRPKYDFFRYLQDFMEYRHYSTEIDIGVANLFKKYNWTVDYKINNFSERLPLNLRHAAGEFPVKLYWAYNNELSKAVGLDFTGYLGKKVKVEIYRLREPLPEFMKPMRNARGIVLISDGKIVGAFIDAGRHDCFACSLNRQSLKQITGKDWNSWVDNYIDYNNQTEKKLASMKPEEIISAYFNALNNHDRDLIYGCLTRRNLSRYLSANMDNNYLYNQSYTEAFPDGETELKDVKLLEISETTGWTNPDRIMEFGVTVDYGFSFFARSENGVQRRFVILKKETPRSGWRIDGIGTGP